MQSRSAAGSGSEEGAGGTVGELGLCCCSSQGPAPHLVLQGSTPALRTEPLTRGAFATALSPSCIYPRCRAGKAATTRAISALP